MFIYLLAYNLDKKNNCSIFQYFLVPWLRSLFFRSILVDIYWFSLTRHNDTCVTVLRRRRWSNNLWHISGVLFCGLLGKAVAALRVMLTKEHEKRIGNSSEKRFSTCPCFLTFLTQLSSKSAAQANTHHLRTVSWILLKQADSYWKFSFTAEMAIQGKRPTSIKSKSNNTLLVLISPNPTELKLKSMRRQTNNEKPTIWRFNLLTSS